MSTICVDDCLQHATIMVTNDLEKLGFSPEEVKVYIALLEIGGGFASSVARRAGAHRVTTYNTLDNLQKKGFVRTTKKGGIKFYYAENPKVILNQIEDSFNTAKILIPELIDLQNAYYFKPKIQFFEGLEGAKNVLKDVSECEGEVLGYTNFNVASEIFHDYLHEYSKTVLKLKKKHRLLCPNDEFNKNYIEKNLQERFKAGILEIFAVNPSQFPFKNAMYIYENKVATISLDKDEMMGVIIESPNNADTNRSIFNLAWLGATSFVAK